MWKLFNLRELHIELSSRCVLRCPRCPRTELPYLHNLNLDYSLSDFQKLFPIHDVQRIVFCGDTGDPIYAKEFIEIIDYIKKTNSDIMLKIVTNGSYKSTQWWQKLANTLNNKDTITFSVDGWDNDSNNLYRVNSNYSSILEGIRIMVNSPVLVNWSTIIFSFNENELSKIENQARQLGVDSLQLVESTKFGNDYCINGIDPLEPSKTILDTVYRKNKIWFGVNRDPEVDYSDIPILKNNFWQKCLGFGVIPFISVTGEFYPCPWFNSGYMPNNFLERNRDKINIRKRTLLEVANDPIWDELWRDIQPICRYKCYES